MSANNSERNTLTIACCQIEGYSAEDEGDPRDRNLELIRDWTERAVEEEDAELVVFAEAFLSGYDNGADTFEYACSLDDTWVTEVGSIADEFSAHIITGLTRRIESPGGGLHNSAILFNDNGELQGVYDKTHLGDLIYSDGISHESAYWDPGETFPVFDVNGVKVGIHICFDIVYPETSRILAVNGAEVIVNPSAAVRGFREGWNRMLPCRALENQVYYAMCAPIGKQLDTHLIGGSRILDPTGEVLTDFVWEEEKLVAATIDITHLQRTRSLSHNFTRRRPEIYDTLSNSGTEDSV